MAVDANHSISRSLVFVAATPAQIAPLVLHRSLQLAGDLRRRFTLSRRHLQLEL
jgi:hypothetical protein